MEFRSLGSQGFAASAIGLGCMGFSQGYGTADDDESLAAMRRAAETGVTMFDTAMTYGRGHNEELVGRFLAEWPARADIRIATKFGIVRDETGVRVDGRPDRVRGYCDASLARLGVDVIDLYYLHRADPTVPVAETVGAMAELVNEGKVRYLAISEVTVEQLTQAHAVHPMSAVQFEWSLLWRTPEADIVPAARALGIGIVAYSPLGRGLLTAALSDAEIPASDFRRNDPRFNGAELASNLAQVEALRRYAAELDVTPAQLALAWLLARGDDVVPIPGSRRAARVDENAAAAQLKLTEDELRGLEELVPDAGWAGNRQSFAVPEASKLR